MSELGEGSITTTEPKDPPPDGKKHVKLRVELFFDGSLNNRVNIDQRLAASADKDLTEEERKAAVDVKKKMSPQDIDKAAVLYKKHGVKKDAEGFSNEENSYEGFYTNVAKMEPHAAVGQNKTPGYDYTLKIYIEGAGSLDKAGDQTPGYAFAIWKSGIRKKVEQGILKVVEEISTLDGIDSANIVIDEITLDVIGFSRGAAAARNFIHEALLHQDTALQIRLEDKGYTFLKRLSVNVCFAGLYDTVSTWGLGVAVGLANNTRALKLHAITHAKAVLHLTSAGEHRRYFALTDTNSAGDNGREYCLPGVHADIGGGYRDDALERQTVFEGGDFTVSDAEADRKQLIDSGLYKPHEITLERAYSEGGESTALTVIRPGIKNHYSRIPLHIMARYAREQGMVFKVELDSDEAVPPELSDVQKRLNNYATGPSKPDAAYWNQNNDPWLRDLRHDYLHFSARRQIGHDPRFEGGKRHRMIYGG